VVTGERNYGSESSRFDAGDDADTVEDLLPEIQDGRIFGILLGAQIHFHGQDVGWLEPGADLNQMVEALEHQAGAYQEHEG
jgi:hypothetical protein